MISIITNLTDAPGSDARIIDIYNKSLEPGAQMRLPAALINEKIRGLEKAGYISIGSLPPWYIAAKRKSRVVIKEKKIELPELKAVPKEPLKEDPKSSTDDVELDIIGPTIRKRNRG